MVGFADVCFVVLLNLVRSAETCGDEAVSKCSSMHQAASSRSHALVQIRKDWRTVKLADVGQDPEQARALTDLEVSSHSAEQPKITQALSPMVDVRHQPQLASRITHGLVWAAASENASSAVENAALAGRRDPEALVQPEINVEIDENLTSTANESHDVLVAARSYETRLKKLGTLHISTPSSDAEHVAATLALAHHSGVVAAGRQNSSSSKEIRAGVSMNVIANSSQNTSLRGSVDAATAAGQNASLRAEVTVAVGMNMTEGANSSAPRKEKPRDKAKKAKKEDQGKTLIIKSGEEAGKATKMDKTEMDYRKGIKSAESGMMAKYGVHPMQAFGFFFLSVMFSCWWKKIYAEHFDNTW